MKKQTLGSIALAIALVFSTTAQVAPANAADANVNAIIKKLNSKGALWKLNPNANSRVAIQSRQRLGLYQQPTAIIDCNLPMSGTWLFVYKNWSQGDQASVSNYFYRSSYYNAEMLYDPKSDYFVIMHMSMGGTQRCLDSAFRALEYAPQD